MPHAAEDWAEVGKMVDVALALAMKFFNNAGVKTAARHDQKKFPIGASGVQLLFTTLLK